MIKTSLAQEWSYLRRPGFVLLVSWGLVAGFLSVSLADTLVVESQVTSTPYPYFEIYPIIGNDGESDIVVYMTLELSYTGGFFEQSDIWYQRLNHDGSLQGSPVQVSSDITYDQFNDISSDYIVYAAYDSWDSSAGTIMLYQISTGSLQPIGDADWIQPPRIHGNTVVWVQGVFDTSEVMIYDLAWLGTGQVAQPLTGSVPPAENVDIGDRFVVWEQYYPGPMDVGAYDLIESCRLGVTSTPNIDERNPSTSGDWIVWESQDIGATNKRIEAINLETGAYRIILDDGSFASHPSMNGDLIAYETDTNGNYDIYIYRISTEETFAVTTAPDFEYLNDVFGDLVAYARGSCCLQNDNMDIYVAKLIFIPSIIYVDANARGANNGTSWTNAYNYLQDALALANAHPGDVNQIWVAKGTYLPDANSANPDGTSDRTATFQLINSVAIYGGYAGHGAPDPDVRDVQLYETILSGDLNRPDDNSDNSYHVIAGSGTEPNAVLDGFTITAGNASEDWPSPYSCGGGMYNEDGSPTVTNCTFSGNRAEDFGGGMYNVWGSGPTVSNCTFSGNWAGTKGSGMTNGNSSSRIINCTFSGNSAAQGGGGLYNHYSDSTVTNCAFTGNSGYWGSGIYNVVSHPSVTNCTFSGNIAWAAPGVGGAIYNIYNSNSMVTNCILWGNTTSAAGNEIALGSSSTMDVKYCNVAGGEAAIYRDGTSSVIWANNIHDDPCFVRNPSDGGDGWGVGNNDDFGDLHLLPGSLCIDAGDNTTVPPDTTDLNDNHDTIEPTPCDLDGNPRFIDDPSQADTGNGTPPIVDMGAYEFSKPPRSDLVYVGLVTASEDDGYAFTETA